MTPTGDKALQVHGIAVRKMFLKATPTSEVQEVDDVVKIRELLHNWQETIIKPEYVLMAPAVEGDVSLWDNWVCNSFGFERAIKSADSLHRACSILLWTIQITTAQEVSQILKDLWW